MSSPLVRKAFLILCCLLLIHAELVNLVEASSTSATSRAGSSPSSTQVSPIPNWGPSWAASTAHGTTIAITCPPPLPPPDQQVQEDESQDAGNVYSSVIVLFKSPRQPSRRGDDDSDTAEENDEIVDEFGGIRLVAPSQQQFSANRWIVLGEGAAVCCMTGLVSDVDYLYRCLLRHADTQRFLYDYESDTDRDYQVMLTIPDNNDDKSDNTLPFPTFDLLRSQNSHSLSVLNIVHKLSDLLKDATRYQGARPFGIQALLVGSLPHFATPVTGKPHSSPMLNLFTVDPSGGYRHWGCATAIGRGATRVRNELYTRLQLIGRQAQKDKLAKSTNDNVSDDLRVPSSAWTSPVTVLRLVLEAALAADDANPTITKTTPPQSPSSSSNSAQPVATTSTTASHYYHGLLIRMPVGHRPGPLLVQCIDPKQLQELQSQIRSSSSSSSAPLSSSS